MTILLSKLQLLVINPKTLYRRRLMDLLYKNLDKKLILLCAGPGYGKTTLLSQFVTDYRLPYVYYHLEKEDAEVSVFIPHLIAGIRKLYPKFGTKTEKTLIPQIPINITLGTFVNELLEYVTNDIYIIIDDYHNLEVPVIDNLMKFLLEQSPLNIHFIITTRSILPIPISNLRAKGEVFELKNEHLCFTREETRAFLNTIFSVQLSDKELDWLAHNSEGWPAGLRLIMQSFDYVEDIDPSKFIARLQTDYQNIKTNIFDYFAQEIFEHEPEYIRDFLVECSALDWLNPELCATITGRKDAGKILAELSIRNTFVSSLPDGNYKLHILFRDFLLAKLTDQMRKMRIYRCAGDYFSKRDPVKAIKFYLDAREFKNVITIIEKIGERLLAEARYEMLSECIEQLPESLRTSNPRVLLYYSQVLSYKGQLERAILYLKEALEMARRDNALYAKIMYHLAGINLNMGNLNKARVIFLKGLKKCPSNLSMIRASIMNSIGAIYNTMGGENLKLAKRYLDKALQIAQNNHYEEMKASILNNLGMNEWKSGNLKQAYMKLSEAVRLLPEHYSIGCGAGYFNAARTSLLLGYVSEAEKTLEQGIKTCTPFNDLWSMANLYKGYSLLFQEKNELSRAREFIEKSLKISEKINVPWLKVTTLIELCRINIEENDFLNAENNLKDIWKLKREKDDAESTIILILEARLRICMKQFSEAEKILETAKKIAEKYHQVLELFLLKIEMLKLYYETNQITKAIQIAKELIKICHRRGYHYLLLKGLCKENLLFRVGLRREEILSLINSVPGNYWIEGIFFGVPTAYVNGKRIKEGDWKTEKAKKLFFYLLLNRNQPINQDNLIEIFWQKSGYAQAKNSLRKAVQHIREALNLNIDPFIVKRGFYQLNPDILITTDIEEFEELVRKKEFKRALSLYQSGFAHGWYDEWVLEKSRQYESFLSSIQ